MIDTTEYRFQGGWREVLWMLRHPIIAIREDSSAYPTYAYNIKQFFIKIWKHLPLQKACRWLGCELIYRVYDNKLLTTFNCRTRGKITKYYFATCCFGYIKFYEKMYVRNGKTCNLFMDFTVGGLVDQENAKKNAEKTETKTRTIYRGWVFTKKKAMLLLRQIIMANDDIFYGPDNLYPTVADSYAPPIADKMLEVLKTGKCKGFYFDDINIKAGFDAAEDNIERLYYHMLEVLGYPNDYKAHYEMAWIYRECCSYLYWKEVEKDPSIDQTCVMLMAKSLNKDVKEYIKRMRKLYSKTSVTKSLEKKINELRDKFINQEYDYYRV